MIKICCLQNDKCCYIYISDNALLTQSRFILMESMLIQFSLFGLLCIIKFRKVMDQPTRFSWWLWLSLGIASLTCAVWSVFFVVFFFLILLHLKFIL